MPPVQCVLWCLMADTGVLERNQPSEAGSGLNVDRPLHGGFLRRLLSPVRHLQLSEGLARFGSSPPQRRSEMPEDDHYIPERDGRRCIDHPKGDHELVCLTCMEASLSAEPERPETPEPEGHEHYYRPAVRRGAGWLYCARCGDYKRRPQEGQ